MQRSLDANYLLALVDNGIDVRAYSVTERNIIDAKQWFAEQNLSHGIENLLQIFYYWSRPHLRSHNKIVKDITRGPEEWSIAFLVHIHAYLGH